MLRGQLAVLLAWAGAALASNGAWADTAPTSDSQSSIRSISPFLAATDGDIISSSRPLNTPDLGPVALPKLRLAQSGCPGTGEKKSAGAQDKTPPVQTNCPIDPGKVAGASIGSSEWNFASPIYWTAKGQLFGETEFHDYSYVEEVFKQSGGTTKSRRQNVDYDQFIQVARYGLTDNISLEADFGGDAYHSETDREPLGVVVKTHSAGWVDPRLNVIYRLLTQGENNSPIYLDLTGEYLPNVYSARAATPDKDGTVATGGQEFISEETFGYETGALTLELSPIFTYSGETRVSGVQYSYLWQEEINAGAFYQLTDRWSFNGDTGYQIAPREGEWGTTYLHGQANYYVVPQVLQVTLEFEHQFIGDEKEYRTLYRNQSGNIFGGRLAYLFDSPGGT
jgi:hypothetical protein